jgi:hypothetical protein
MSIIEYNELYTLHRDAASILRQYDDHYLAFDAAFGVELQGFFCLYHIDSLSTNSHLLYQLIRFRLDNADAVWGDYDTIVPTCMDDTS